MIELKANPSELEKLCERIVKSCAAPIEKVSQAEEIQVNVSTSVDPIESDPAPAVRSPSKRWNTKAGMLVISGLERSTVTKALRDSGKPFAQTLLAKLTKYGNWSNDQEAWAHKLANEFLGTNSAPAQAEAPKEALPLPVTTVSENTTGSRSFLKVIEMMDAAAETGLRRPKITFKLPSGQVQIVRNLGGKKPGSISITDGGSFGNNTFYGRIHRDGSYERPKFKQVPSHVYTLLSELTDDPVSTASEYGKKSGRCCFCNKELKDAISVEAGMGETCAKNYSMQAVYAEAKVRIKEQSEE